MPCLCRLDDTRPSADPTTPPKPPMPLAAKVQYAVLFVVMFWFVWGSGLVDPFLHT
jgi:hypothetical protein